MHEVSTLVVEWIEIRRTGSSVPLTMSPPSWWSGLKLGICSDICYRTGLHPRGGVD